MIEEEVHLQVVDGRVLALAPDVFLSRPDHLVVVRGRSVHLAALAGGDLLTRAAAVELLAAGAVHEAPGTRQEGCPWAGVPGSGLPDAQVRYGTCCPVCDPGTPTGARVVVVDDLAEMLRLTRTEPGEPAVLLADPRTAPVVAASSYAIGARWASGAEVPTGLLRLLRGTVACTDPGTRLHLDRAVPPGEATRLAGTWLRWLRDLHGWELVSGEEVGVGGSPSLVRLVLERT